MPDDPKVMIEPATRAALGRLTENEKVCLRRRLRPQTAKEMALDLGISPHAVEKRLKMARAKLGVTSSLHAARLLARVERDGRQLDYQTSDLALPDPVAHIGRPNIGQWRMIMIGALLITSTVAAIYVAPVSPQDGASPDVRGSLGQEFARMDRDGSGFIAGAELDKLPSSWLAQYDGNHDGRVSKAELIAGTKGVFVLQAVKLDPQAAR